MQRIADTGLLVAALDAADQHHAWGKAQLARYAPFHTCEPVLIELAFVLNDAMAGLKMVARGDLIVNFSLASHTDRLLELLEKYADLPMDIADACIVRMTETEDRSQVWTVDENDFRIYRRHGHQTVPCSFPPKA